MGFFRVEIIVCDVTTVHCEDMGRIWKFSAFLLNRCYIGTRQHVQP